jgi:hypothetical protein
LDKAIHRAVDDPTTLTTMPATAMRRSTRSIIVTRTSVIARLSTVGT